MSVVVTSVRAMTTPLLLLSGAGLPAWIWDEVRADLFGIETRVVDYPRESASLAEYAEAAVATADGWDSFGVVAHSLGGVIGSELVAQAPERVAGFLGVAAIVPKAGKSFVNALPFPQRHVVSFAMWLMGTKPPAKSIRDDLCAGIRRDQAERIALEFDPESEAVYRDPVSARTFPATCGYVVTDKERAFPVGLQKKYAAELDAEIHRIQTGHLPMLQQSNALAGIITEFFEKAESQAP